MFDKKFSIPYLIISLGLVMVVSYIGDSIRQKFTNRDLTDDYEMVKKYLLNDNPLYGKNRPKIWIHSKYEINARKWKNFMSRNTTDLNQPYLYLTIQSIINHCGDDFHICLIDDESFSKLIPTWTVQLSTIPEPMRSRYRNQAMLQLLYIYGGMIVPNSFLCVKPLLPLYKEGVSRKTPFMAESLMRVPTISQSKPYLPDMYFMGAEKEDAMVQRMLVYLQEVDKNYHFQKETEFESKFGQWCYEQVTEQHILLIEGNLVGIKTKIGKPILLEDLMSDDYLDVDLSTLQGIYIPADELLRRPKFQYFAILPVEDVMKTDTVLTKYFKLSMVEGVDDRYKKYSNDVSIISI
jgi:hypothetical protein